MRRIMLRWAIGLTAVASFAMLVGLALLTWEPSLLSALVGLMAVLFAVLTFEDAGAAWADYRALCRHGAETVQ